MQVLPQTASARDLKVNPNTVFDKALRGPVLVLSKATPRAVIISPEIWDATANELARLRRIIKADRVLADMKAGDYVTHEEFIASLADSA